MHRMHQSDMKHLLHVQIGDDNLRIGRGHKTFIVLSQRSKVVKEIDAIELRRISTALDIGIQLSLASKWTSSGVGHRILYLNL